LKPAAYVVLRPGFIPAADLAHELQEFVTSRLAVFKRPRWVEFVPQLPRTATGKLQRYKLRETASRA
jgi:benzoate-CoA ligase